MSNSSAHSERRRVNPKGPWVKGRSSKRISCLFRATGLSAVFMLKRTLPSFFWGLRRPTACIGPYRPFGGTGAPKCAKAELCDRQEEPTQCIRPESSSWG